MMQGKTTGFASPAQGYEQAAIDFNALLVKRPSSTFYFKLDTGDMSNGGLAKGSLLVVDRSKNPVPHDFVLLAHEGRFICRQLEINNGVKVFKGGKQCITPVPGETLVIGVVTAAIQVFNHDNAH